MRHLLITVAALGLALLGTGSAFGQTGGAAPDPAEFTPPGYTFCGWRDLSNGGWTTEWDDDLAGTVVVAFARDMTCGAARRNAGRLKYSAKPPYAPHRAGYRCARLKKAYEYDDTRCRKIGARATFRVQSGS